LKREASSTGENRPAKAPSFKTIFDWRREKGEGLSRLLVDERDELKPKTRLYCIFSILDGILFL
jgi:hypothetical protein